MRWSHLLLLLSILRLLLPVLLLRVVLLLSVLLLLLLLLSSCRGVSHGHEHCRTALTGEIARLLLLLLPRGFRRELRSQLVLNLLPVLVQVRSEIHLAAFEVRELTLVRHELRQCWSREISQSICWWRMRDWRQRRRESNLYT